MDTVDFHTPMPVPLPPTRKPIPYPNGDLPFPVDEPDDDLDDVPVQH